MTKDKIIEGMARMLFTRRFPYDNPDCEYPRGPAWKHFCLREATAVYNWLTANGWTVVPVEPTEAMLKAGDEMIVEGFALARIGHPDAANSAEGDIYRAMIQAAQEGKDDG